MDEQTNKQTTVEWMRTMRGQPSMASLSFFLSFFLSLSLPLSSLHQNLLSLSLSLSPSTKPYLAASLIYTPLHKQRECWRQVVGSWFILSLYLNAPTSLSLSLSVSAHSKDRYNKEDTLLLSSKQQSK